VLVNSGGTKTQTSLSNSSVFFVPYFAASGSLTFQLFKLLLPHIGKSFEVSYSELTNKCMLFCLQKLDLHQMKRLNANTLCSESNSRSFLPAPTFVNLLGTI
jgi:hypothetical protein